jgi:hypothetical protein
VATATNPASFDFRGGTLFYSDYDVVGSQLENALDTVLTTGHLYGIDLGVCGVRQARFQEGQDLSSARVPGEAP